MKPFRHPPLFSVAAVGFSLLVIGLPEIRAVETNLPPATNTNLQTVITSKVGYFDIPTRSLVYRDHVRVVDPRINLTCEFLQAKFPTNGSHRVSSIIAETNVVVLIATNDITYTITAARAVYSFQPDATTTNEMLEVTGLPAPVIRWAPNDEPSVKTNEFTAKKIIWDLANNRITAEDHSGTFPDLDMQRRNKKDATSPTNSVSPNAAPESKPATP